jgi:hypothetical protein
LRRAIAVRRTDRRPIADRPIPAEALVRLRAAAEAAGAHLVFAARLAQCAVVVTDADQPRDWIAAGEAASAVLLAATVEGLATDLLGVPSSRALYDVPGGAGHPAIAVRVGVPANGIPAPTAPGRW